MIPLVLLFIFVNNAGAIISNVANNKELKSVMGKISGIVSQNDTALPLNFQAATPPVSRTNDFEIQGVLIDEHNNKPLAGVNVIIGGGTTRGTISDADGSFRLKVNEGDSILFSHIGYTGLAYAIKNKKSNTGTLLMKRKREEISEIIVVGYGSSEDQLPETDNLPQQTVSAQDEIFMVVEEMPEFPGGQNELMSFIARTVKYPVLAQKNGIQGRVTCSFVVDASGTIINPEIVRSIDPSLDNEALRIIYSMPKWKPGRQRGKAVSVQYTVPINFRLQQ